MLICGIDEAGRGPAIGPLVIAGVAIHEEQEAQLKALGVRDSKLLTPAQRERLDAAIRQVGRALTYAIEPAEIDAAVTSDETNLNWLEADYAARILNELAPDVAYLDCPSPNIEAFVEYVRQRLTVKCQVVAEHRADAKYPVVGAASIVAKVLRDAKIAALKAEFGVDFGSGYPADPATQAFLDAHYADYPFFRTSWESYKRIVEQKRQRQLGDFSGKPGG